MPAIFQRPLDQLAALLHGRSYWGILLADGKWYTELDTKVDIRKDRLPHAPWAQNLEWYDDVVATATHRHIKELWLFCPRTEAMPFGATCKLEIDHLNMPYSAFQIKGACMSFGGPKGRYQTWQLIGRVDNMATGDCTYYAFDYLNGKLYHGRNNVLGMRPWREGGPRIGLLNLEVVGLSEFAQGIKRRGNMQYVIGLAENALDGAIIQEDA